MAICFQLPPNIRRYGRLRSWPVTGVSGIPNNRPVCISLLDTHARLLVRSTWCQVSDNMARMHKPVNNANLAAASRWSGSAPSYDAQITYGPARSPTPPRLPWVSEIMFEIVPTGRAQQV